MFSSRNLSKCPTSLSKWLSTLVLQIREKKRIRLSSPPPRMSNPFNLQTISLAHFGTAFFRWHCKFSKSRMRYWSRAAVVRPLSPYSELGHFDVRSMRLTYWPICPDALSAKDRGRFDRVAMLFGSFGMCPRAWRTLGWRRWNRDGLIPILPTQCCTDGQLTAMRRPRDISLNLKRYVCVCMYLVWFYPLKERKYQKLSQHSSKILFFIYRCWTHTHIIICYIIIFKLYLKYIFYIYISDYIYISYI